MENTKMNRKVTNQVASKIAPPLSDVNEKMEKICRKSWNKRLNKRELEFLFKHARKIEIISDLSWRIQDYFDNEIVYGVDGVNLYFTYFRIYYNDKSFNFKPFYEWGEYVHTYPPINFDFNKLVIIKRKKYEEEEEVD